MQSREHGFYSREASAWVLFYRDTSTIVDNNDMTIFFNDHLYLIAMTRERLVNGIIDYFVDEMMKACLSSTSNVHSGPHSDSFEALKDPDVLCTVVRLFCFRRGRFCFFSSNDQSAPVPERQTPDGASVHFTTASVFTQSRGDFLLSGSTDGDTI